MTFNPNIPQPTDDLSDSQGDLLTNNGALDTSFGIDHYKFSDPTSSNGFHNKVTTPVFVANPPTGLPPDTSAGFPIFYGFQQTAPIGVIQWSRGPSNAVPSPVTILQSTSAAITLANLATSNVLDFTGLTSAFGMIIASNNSAPLARSAAYVVWDGNSSLLFVGALPNGLGNLSINTSGNVLRVQNNSGSPMSNIYWSLQLFRAQ